MSLRYHQHDPIEHGVVATDLGLQPLQRVDVALDFVADEMAIHYRYVGSVLSVPQAKLVNDESAGIRVMSPQAFPMVCGSDFGIIHVSTLPQSLA